MVTFYRNIRIILTERPVPKTQEESLILNQELDPLIKKIDEIKKINSRPAIITDALFLGRQHVEEVELSYISNGTPYEQTFPRLAFRGL